MLWRVSLAHAASFKEAFSIAPVNLMGGQSDVVIKVALNISSDGMRRSSPVPIRTVFSILCTFWLGYPLSSSAAPSATLHSAQGNVEKRGSVLTNWSAARIGNQFEPGDACRTDLNSRGGVLFMDGILVRLNETTQLDFKPPTATARRSSFFLRAGSAYFLSRRPTLFPQVDTPLVSAAVQGTEFVVQVTANQTIISVLDGQVECWNALNANNRLQVNAGEEAVTVAGAAPVKRIMVRPWDAVQWALYYPALLDAVEMIGIGFPDAASQASAQQSVAAYKAGDFSAAFAAINQIPDPKPPVLLLQQSAMYLAVGQVPKAEAILQTLSQPIATLAPDARARVLAVSQSQQAIIALINNRRDEAIGLAEKAASASRESAAAALAMSHAHQGQYNLKEAKRWAETAMKLQPESATVRARLAELQLGFGQLNEAVRTVEEGLKTGGNDSRLLSVAGFAYLTRYETKRALEMFERAILLDNASGLPRLGRGLALIRQNKLHEGRLELEFAVHLEPSDSLFRSYLGKAYFEEKRDPLAAHEYGLARQLDPLDPTPFLYDAFHKLGNARPVEALWDVEDSIRLNDNRAVYRSRSLLDQDQAVRSVGLSQIFNQIGFVEAGRTEAVKSINRDYGNFSAHLLLAGSYFDRPQLNQAVISEQLVARLLAPVNINSVRGEASFNEYTSLFDRQRAQFFFLSEARSADDFIQAAPRAAVAGERFAMSVVYGARYQGGYRDNDEVVLLAPAALMQYQLTPSDTISLETLQFEVEEEDTSMGYNPNRNDPDLSHDLDSFTQRLGWHHRFGPGSHLIAQGLYLRRESRVRDVDEPQPFPVNLINQTQYVTSEGVRGDAQHIWDTPWFSLVTGGAIVDAEDRKREATLLRNFGATIDSRGSTPAKAERAYFYSTWHLSRRIDLTAGVSYGRVEFSEVSVPLSDEETRIEDAIDPKAGLVFRLTPATTLRAAYYETLGSAGDSDLESIEPTQIAGFNQLFDDPAGTRARGAGVGLDQKIAKRTYAGVEALWRESEWSFGYDARLFRGTLDNVVFERRAQERSVRAYLYQVIHPTATATIEYVLLDRSEDSSRDPFGLFADRSDDQSLTHRVRLGVNRFLPSGLFAGVGVTWRHQTLEDFEQASDGIPNGKQDFCIVDATLGYQFPQRTGYIAFSFNNLFDEDFRYHPVGIDQRLVPEFSANARLFLNF